MTAYYFKKSEDSFRKVLKIAGLGFILLGASFLGVLLGRFLRAESKLWEDSF